MIIFIIPAYNEAKNISTLLLETDKKMRDEKLPFRIIIVNDGSTDDTLNVIGSLKDKIPVDVYSHYPNKGVGEVFRVGFRQALEIAKDDDIIITKEADNTSDLNILSRLISKINEGYDVALASCYTKEGGVIGTTPLKLLLSKGANILLKSLIPLKNVNTYSSFYRAYSAKVLKEMRRIYGGKFIEQNGFECMVELLIKLSRNPNFKIIEVPMILNGSKRIGKSKMRILKTIKGFLKVMLKESVLYRIKAIFRLRQGEL